MSKQASAGDTWAARLAEYEAESVRLDLAEGYTTPHARRLAAVADKLAVAFGFSERGRRDLRIAALLHDIGESRLDLPFLAASHRLTLGEWQALWRHPVVGERAIYERHLPEAIGLLIRWHHENWDGSGYPDGLRGEQIPLAARLLRLADVWCALTQDRPFRSAYQETEAIAHLRTLAGTALDPTVTAYWLADPTVNDSAACSEPLDILGLTPWTVSQTTVHQAPLLGFEVAALQKEPFHSIALPFGDDGSLGWRLKLLGKQVVTNDPRQAETYRAIAVVENNGYILTASQVDTWLSAAHDAAQNDATPITPALTQWLPLPQVRWLAGLRQAILQTPERITRALGMSLGLYLGDYWLGFDIAARHLCQTLEEAAIEALPRLNRAVDNRLGNQATCLPAHVFVLQTVADAVYLRLPPPAPYDHTLRHRDGWRETWVSNHPGALTQLALTHNGCFGGYLTSRREYRAALRFLLRRLPHFPRWIISFTHESEPPRDLLEEISTFRAITEVVTKSAGECSSLRNQSIVFCKPVWERQTSRASGGQIA
ncbi:MAG: HD-GYP domain-containing protein [Acidobacteriota bacterium]